MADLQASADAWGLVLVQPPAPPLELWADVVPAVRLFAAMRGQWVLGPGGAVALNRMALPAHLAPGRGGRRAARLLSDLAVMEAAALDLFTEERRRDAMNDALKHRG